MKTAIMEFGVGPVLATYRYFVSLKETRRLRIKRDGLSEAHLASMRAYPGRLEMMQDLVAPGSVVAEVGVARGDFSQKLVDRLAPSRLILIDYWKASRSAHGLAPGAGLGRKTASPDQEIVRTRFAPEISSGQVETIRALSWDGLGMLEDGSLDAVYIDAGHDYDSVRRDLSAALPKMKPDGVICGHDYVRWGRYGFRNGVIEAVTEFCLENGYAMAGLTFEAQYPPSYALRRLESRSRPVGPAGAA